MPQIARSCRRALASAWQSERVDPSDWVTLLSADDGLRLQPSASADDVRACEAELGSPLPPDLRNLYLAADGVWDEPGQWFVIWPLAQVAERNPFADEVEGPDRRGWIGFGDDGTGSPFCVNRQGGSAVYHWSSIDQTATCLAGDVVGFWAAWIAGSLPAH